VLSSPEDEIDADTRARRVRVALDQLTPRDREALLLWDAGMSYDEIAAQTDWRARNWHHVGASAPEIGRSL